MSRGFAQGYPLNLWTRFTRSAQGPQTSALFDFNNLVVHARVLPLRRTRTPQMLYGEYRGEGRSQTISKAQLLKPAVADNDRTVRDGAGQKQAVTQKIRLAQAEIIWQDQQQAE